MIMEYITATTGEEFISPELQLPGEDELLDAEREDLENGEGQTCEFGCQDVCAHILQGEQ
ncbi:hypothetical protein [Pseudomonas sp. Teo4]|uniref:hypothetical protein n=1 Tax=Pseudomonas sp. Teo4 TaxID=3064528 RepID=UPI002AB85036|nr:hypothetical protein [Pseudomonas sp. Teo4]MDZ3990937.1 hypothetical protein [Pseudomonas sp. Teo4]